MMVMMMLTMDGWTTRFPPPPRVGFSQKGPCPGHFKVVVIGLHGHVHVQINRRGNQRLFFTHVRFVLGHLRPFLACPLKTSKKNRPEGSMSGGSLIRSDVSGIIAVVTASHGWGNSKKKGSHQKSNKPWDHFHWGFPVNRQRDHNL